MELSPVTVAYTVVFAGLVAVRMVSLALGAVTSLNALPSIVSMNFITSSNNHFFLREKSVFGCFVNSQW